MPVLTSDQQTPVMSRSNGSQQTYSGPIRCPEIQMCIHMANHNLLDGSFMHHSHILWFVSPLMFSSQSMGTLSTIGTSGSSIANQSGPHFHNECAMITPGQRCTNTILHLVRTIFSMLGQQIYHIPRHPSCTPPSESHNMPLYSV